MTPININLPIYDTLLSSVVNMDLTIEEKNDFMEQIKKLDLNGLERVYVIIRIFHINNSNENTTFNLPYGGLFIKEEMRFDLEKIPFKLKQILYLFIKIHLNTM